MENDYHNPYDHHLGNAGMNDPRLQDGLGGVVGSGGEHMQNHYEAPSCLVRNPSGSLFIPSSGNYTFIIRLRLLYVYVRLI